MKRQIILLTISIGLFSCNNSPCELTEKKRDEITKEVAQITNSIFELADKKDMNYNKPISDNVTAVFSGTIMESWPKHKQQMIDFFAGQEKIESKIDVIKVDVLSVDAAVVLGKYSIKATDKSGTTISSPPACITYVFSRINDEWKVIHFHDSEQK
jgi:ketosteroid isomerase-like protein